MGAAVEDNEEFEYGDGTDDAPKANGARHLASPPPAGRPSSSTTMTKKPSPPAADASVLFTPELLGMYYARLFPYQLLYSWLSYDPSTANAVAGDGKERTPSSTLSTSTFPRREFSMTIEPSPGNEVYIRYQSFLSRSDLASAITKRRPTKIDIGAVFNHPPKDHKSLPAGKLRTVERELVFDIDLTDYDEVRNCGCSGARICEKCWTYMGMAIEAMDAALREDFGFEHIQWFYSGRRGVHCWVCDESARKLTNEARSAVASYFEVNLGSDTKKAFHLPSPLHPMLSRAYGILEPHFVDCVLPEEGHGLLATQASWTKLLNTVPDGAIPVTSRLAIKWNSPRDQSTPRQKWHELKEALRAFVGRGAGAKKSPKNLSAADRTRIEQWPVETVFRHTYPRLDINVSKMQNHLLKSPFCVHPKTGRVCVPIDAAEARTFDPFTVPTLAQLMRELDEYEADEGNKDRATAHDWQKTSLKESFEKFQKTFLVPLLKEERRARREERERERKAAVVGDF